MDKIGFCSLGTEFQNMASKVLREYFRMGESSGIRVISVWNESCLSGLVQKNDVLIKIDGNSVQNDGVVCGTFGINTNAFIAMKDFGEKVSLTFLRLGEELNFNVHVTPFLMADIVDEHSPMYYVYADFVFTFSLGGQLIISEVLESTMNMGYTSYDGCVVLFVNGEKAVTLKHLASLIQQAAEYVRLELINGHVLVLKRSFENQSAIMSKIQAGGGNALMKKLE